MHYYVPNRTRHQLLRLHTLALNDGHCGFVVHGCGSHTLLDVAGHEQESLLEVRNALC
jgi:hypothetical protein